MLESYPDEVIVIEKIILVQSRDFLEINSLRLPMELRKSSVGFFLDSQLLQLHVEQPFVIVCHTMDSPNTRIIEQHHFMVLALSIYNFQFVTNSHGSKSHSTLHLI